MARAQLEGSSNLIRNMGMYRNEQVAANLQLTSYRLRSRSPELLRLLACQRARIAAGFVGVLGAISTLLAAVACHLGAMTEGAVVAVFLGTWPVVALTWIAAFVLTADLQVGLPKMDRSLGEVDPLREVARRKNDTDGARLRALAIKLGPWSLTWPLWAVILLGPLTLHALYFLPDVLLNDPTSWVPLSPLSPFSSLGWWIIVSVGITWLPHLVLCGLAFRFCRQLHNTTLEAPEKSVWRIGSFHLLLTAASVLPSALIFIMLSGYSHFEIGELFMFVVLIAAVLIFVTGMAFLPLAYWLARKRYHRTRGILEAVEAVEVE